MQVDELPSIDPNVDYSQILPIKQKRTIAFINHFIMNTVSFLNTFAQSCESRLMEFEYKLQKVEASLAILETQLSSISDLKEDEIPNVNHDTQQEEHYYDPPEQEENLIENKDIPECKGVKSCDDKRYQRFFKMVQFGVPPAAVKLKMQAEGLDPNILDTPSIIVSGSQPTNSETISDNSSND